jgi:chemotaxis protein histidine kinase CheA
VAAEDRDKRLKAELDAVRLRFAATLPGRLLGLGEGVLKALAAGNSEAARWKALREEAHRLAGAGATFGHPAVSRLAAEAEQRLEEIETMPSPWRPELVAALREVAIALSSLSRKCGQGPTRETRGR